MPPKLKPGAGAGSMSGPVGTTKDAQLSLEHLRSMQQMEKDTQSTLEKFMSALSQHAQTDYAGMLEEKIRELNAAGEEIRRLGNEVLRNEERINELTMKEEKSASAQATYIEEQMKSARALSQSDQVIKKLQAQLVSQQHKQHQDLEAKATTLRALEEESLRSKVQCDEAHARMESMQLEAAELHSAMASLHGEIAAQQREIDEFQEREQRSSRQKKEMAVRLEEKDVDIGRLKVERRALEAKLTDMDKRLSEAAARDNLLQHEASSQVEQLVRERDTVHGSLAKMSFKLKQQTGTQKELNALLSKMRLDLAAAQDGLGMEKARAEAAEREVAALQIVSNSLEKAKMESDITLLRAEQDRAGLQSDLQQLADSNAHLLSEQRRSTAALERLERERTELTIDLSGRVKDIESYRKAVEALQTDQEDLRARLDHERMAKERALESSGALDGELERLRSDLREHQENSDSLGRQLRESERMREQALEVSRAQQRENANRIIEFSQKNSKLASELSAKEDEVSMLRKAREDVLSQGQDSLRERDDFKQQYYAARARLQGLEDQNEEASARLEASKGEVEELRVALRREVASREQVVSGLRGQHEEVLAALTARLEGEAEERVAQALASRRQAEDRLERAVVKEKEAHAQMVADLQGQRAQDAEGQRARLSTLAKAMEGLQVELREETNKNAVLSQELAVLRDLAEVGSGEMQERIQYVERERLRDRNRLEGQLADVKEQLRQQVEQKQQRDQLTSTIEQQLSREREARFSALQRVRSAEDEASNLAAQLDAMTEECGAAKKAVRDHERKLALALQAKDAELLRLTRRNEVLGEAVTRLTAAQQPAGDATARNPVSRYFSSTGASRLSAQAEEDEEQSPLDMEGLGLGSASTFSAYSASTAPTLSRARSAPAVRPSANPGHDEAAGERGCSVYTDDDFADGPETERERDRGEGGGGGDDRERERERVSSAPAGAVRRSAEMVHPRTRSPQAWQDVGFANGASPRLRGVGVSQGGEAAAPLLDIEKLLAQVQQQQQSQQDEEEQSARPRPPSPIVVSQPQREPEAAPGESLFKKKLEQSVASGKGRELSHSPKKQPQPAPQSLAEAEAEPRAQEKDRGGETPDFLSPRALGRAAPGALKAAAKAGTGSGLGSKPRPLSGSGTRRPAPASSAAPAERSSKKGPVF